ncbi:MAG: DUF721 domain-containing protein [Bacteroidales bacterium]|nr:DUF721 domain-containing protein [Bacteroidales bacterium]
MEGKWDTSKRLSEVVMEYMRDNDITKKMLENRAISLWQVVIGPTAQRSTKNVYMHDGVMYVEMTSSVVRHELLMLKSHIISRLNEAVGKQLVTDIIFK